MVYNEWLMTSFNIFFVNVPVLALGILVGRGRCRLNP